MSERHLQAAVVYRSSPSHQRELIERWLQPEFEGKRAEWLHVLSQVEESLQGMSDEEVSLLYRPDRWPDWYRAYRLLTREIQDACHPFLRKPVLVDGAFYRVRCRNASCGIWRSAEQGFEIPRTKFDSSFLFIEYHYDNGPPFGTASPYERLEDIPDEVLQDPKLRLDYLMKRDVEVRAQDEKRFELKLQPWEPLP